MIKIKGNMKIKHLSRGLTLLFVLIMVLSGVMSPFSTPRDVQAATEIVVNSLADSLSNDGTCTLREAVIAANKDASTGDKPGECAAGSGSDTITFDLSSPPPWVIQITRTDTGKEDAAATGDLDIFGNLTIQGPGADILTVKAVNARDRVFHIPSSGANLTIYGITITGGKVGSSGGGIYNNGTLFLMDSVVDLNTATGEGGGIFNTSTGKLTVERSTISNNLSGSHGGGIAGAGTWNLLNSTIAKNTSSRSGGGVSSSGTAWSNNLTVGYNQASTSGGGIYSSAGAFYLKNTLMAGNTAKGLLQDCVGTLVSQGYNLIQNKPNNCAVTEDLTGNISPLVVNLASTLANNGGSTPTLALLDGSPAINAGSPNTYPAGSACLPTDQRGYQRPSGTGCDIGAYETQVTAAPVIIRASTVELVSGDSVTRVVGRLFSQENATFTIEIFYNTSCDPTSPGASLGTTTVTTSGSGSAMFLADLSTVLATETTPYITAIAYDSNGIASATSPCIRLGAGNDSWPEALAIDLGGSSLASTSSLTTGSIKDYLDLQGHSRWFKVSVQPGSKLTVTLTNLPDNYDLSVYKDIGTAYKSLSEPQDLVQLSAEFAPDIFSPDIFSPDIFSPDIFSPDIFSPDAYGPEIFSPDIFSPDIFSPDAYYPDIFSPESFSSAQARSLVAVSAFDGTLSEGIRVNTWDNSGDYYIRVRGRNGSFNLNMPFLINVTLSTGACENVIPVTTAHNLDVEDADYETIILTDMKRMGIEPGSETEIELLARLNALKMRQEVKGVVVDVGADQRVVDANELADANPQCPYAKNLVAEAIKEVVDRYWSVNPLKYVVIIGDDGVIPFFRYPDNAGLANERNFAPPVSDDTASQASLRLGYLLTQDRYGSRTPISVKANTLWIPELAVGRLVETPAEVMNMLDAYLATGDGTVSTPTTALVSGYDFLSDSAFAIKTELEAGLNMPVDTLIFDPDKNPPEVPWTASELREILSNSRHDLIALAGHFSQATTLAADYQTRLSTEDLLDPSIDLLNSIVFSPGCHSGYNVVNADAVSGVTLQPDWAQAFARKGATLIAGTGYQYADTDFIEYGERLYLEFSKQLRAGIGAVSVGEALVNAKQAYLAGTPQMRGIHEKSLQIVTLFGLPMLKVDLPAGRGNQPGESSVVSGTMQFLSAPGSVLGLEYADQSLPFNLAIHTVDLKDPITNSVIDTATYLSGSDGQTTRPGEPTSPLEIVNVSPPVEKPGLVLRGVGFRGGQYTELANILPLSGAPTTEVRGLHTPFTSRVFYPIKPWEVNYFDALTDPLSGTTQLYITPAQIQTPDPASYKSTLRAFNQMDFRLYYSKNISDTIALSGAPTIVQVNDLVGDLATSFDVRVVGNPAAGIQEVWVTYTNLSAENKQWQSISLAQDAEDSTHWIGSLDVGSTAAKNIRYIVQAVNGVGLVSMDTNLGSYYTPGERAGQTTATTLTFNEHLPNGAYGTESDFSAILATETGPLVNMPVIFKLGPHYRRGITDAGGRVTVMLPLLVYPGDYPVRAYFPGGGIYQSTSAETRFSVTQQVTQIELTSSSASVYPGQDSQIVATLTDITGHPLDERTLVFIVHGLTGEYRTAVITDYAGRAPLGAVPLPKGSYQVDVYFNGVIPLPEGGWVTLEEERYASSLESGSLTHEDSAPVANLGPDAYTVAEDSVLQVDAPGVLGNDTDADGDPLTAVLASRPAHGSLELNLDGSFTYTPDSNFFGTDSFTYQASDGELLSIPAIVTVTVSDVAEPPVCVNAQPSTYFIWPPNNSDKFIPVSILFVTDPDSTFNVAITSIYQDEPVGTGTQSPDGDGVGTSTALLRAERDQNQNGRVYRIFFTATDDPTGLTCSGMVRTAVYDNQGGVAEVIIDAIDDYDIAHYDSTIQAE